MDYPGQGPPERETETLTKTVNMNRREFICKAGAASLPLLAGSNLCSEAMYQPNLPPLGTIIVGGLAIHPASPPKQFHNYPDLGIIVNRGMSASRIWAHQPPEQWCNAPGWIKTPGGDYLLMFAMGRGDYHNTLQKRDDMVAFRSSDQGKTWTGPKVAWNIPYNQHCFVPLVPRGVRFEEEMLYDLPTRADFQRLAGY